MDFHLLQIKSDIPHLYNSHWLINGGFHILKLGIRTPLPLIFVDGYSFILDIWRVNKLDIYREVGIGMKCRVKDEWVSFTYGGIYSSTLTFGYGKVFTCEVKPFYVRLSTKNIVFDIKKEDFEKYFEIID